MSFEIEPTDTFWAHEDFIDDQIFAPLIAHAKEQNVQVAELVACTFYHMAIELSMSGVTEGQMRAMTILAAEAAKELNA